MKRVILLGVFFIFSTLGNAQILNDTTPGHAKPKVQVKVNKVYDENGNVVRYDSVYTWSYHSGNQIDVDSLMGKFMPYFHQHFSDSLFEHFSQPVFPLSDSALMLDFFNNDHFFDQWHEQLFDFKHQLQAMDSLKRQFFKQFLRQNKVKHKSAPPAGIY
jgi:hypothetical protein